MTNRITMITLLGLGCAASASSCVRETLIPVEDHCANQYGDQWCRERYDDGARPYCILGNGVCGRTEGKDGCVEELPTADCYSPCGYSATVEEDATCLDGSSSSGSGGSGSSGTGETDSGTSSGSESGESTTTGPVPCMGNEDCTDAAAPFCDPAGECVDCGQLADGSAACAEADPGLPVCEAGACVACTADDIGACEGATPICDVETNTCVPCTEHDQCGEAACNLFTGACLPMDAVVHVGSGQAFSSISAAVNSFAAGAEGTIVVHGGDYNNQAVTVTGGRTLAFLADQLGAGVQPPRWVQSAGGSPQLTVSNATVLLDGIQVSGNASSTDPGVLVDGGQAWIDRSRVVTNLGGGIAAQSAAELVLRNCFVGGSVNNVSVLDVVGSNAMVNRTTLVGGLGSTTETLACGAGSTVAVSDSIVLIQSDNPPVSCAAATFDHTASEMNLPGAGNANVGNFNDLSTWFTNVATGDFHLATSPASISTTAQWNTGDPATDIDGQPRPSTDGANDVAGADVP